MCDSPSDEIAYSGMANEVVQCKKAAIIVIFILYLVYVICMGLSTLLKWKEERDHVKNKDKADPNKRMLS